MSTGWVKLHRQLLDWEWYNDVNTTRVFLHLLIVSNHKDNKWRGIDIKRGQRLTSISALASETNLSIKNIRTSIKRLKSTNEVASYSTAQHTVFTMVNYDLYQEEANEVANKGQAKGKPRATNKNDKTEKNDNKDLYQLVVDEFNSKLSELGEVKVLSDKRKAWIKGSIKQMEKTKDDFSDIETWVRYFNYVSGIDFLMGRKTDFTATFDFLVNKNNLLKVVEGNYDN
jgi:hypothetical protein